MTTSRRINTVTYKSLAVAAACCSCSSNNSSNATSKCSNRHIQYTLS